MAELDAYEDDPSIADGTLLLRRVLTRPDVSIVWDDNLSRWRPSSVAFEDHRNGTPMSIVLTDTLDAMGRSYESALAGHEDTHSLAAISAGLARQCAQKVAREPTQDEPAHGVVVGQKTKKIQRKLAKAAEWIVEPRITRSRG